MDHPFDEMSPELQEKIAKTTVALLDKQTPEIDNLRAEGDRLKKALETIASGMGADMLGTVSLSREDMQSIASNALAIFD